MISIGISSTNYSHLLQRQLEQYVPPHATKLIVTFPHEPTWNDLFRLFDNIDQETGIILEGVTLLHDGMPIMVAPEHVKESVEPRLPIKEGRYFTEKEMKSGEKVALIGSEWERDTTIIGNERYIVLSGERYKCIGIIGIMGENSRLLDSQVLIPMTSLPPSVISKL
ncbi:MAG: ABC transporter permease, partial [Anoxybacillus ayderensis]|nr:ABC transporter permease [Anoxybacillus ayderensis]